MKKFEITTYSKTILADTLTPVNVYLKIRDKFSNPLFWKVLILMEMKTVILLYVLNL